MDIPVYRQRQDITPETGTMTTNQLIEESVQCPYCWQNFTLLIDASVELQQYIEDCEVCCHPIDFIVRIDDQDQARIQIRQAGE